MKNTIYAEEFGIALEAEVVGNGLRLAIVRLGNSPNEGEEIASATIANYFPRQKPLHIWKITIFAPQFGEELPPAKGEEE